MTREALFDRVAGLLLREVDERAVVSALCLYPPGYSGDHDGPPTHVFMFLLEERTDRSGRASSDDWSLAGEYTRIAELATAKLADASLDHYPQMERT